MMRGRSLGAALLRTPSVRVLDEADLSAVIAVLARDPVANCFVTARVENGGIKPSRLGGELWGYGVGREIEALCFYGANLVPVADSDAAIRAFADYARRRGRYCSSIVGPFHTVQPLWEMLRPHWGPPRDVRRNQPLMATSSLADVRVDPWVHRVQVSELDMLLPACVAMFTEEVGVSPLGADGGAAYRLRVRRLIESGRSFARIENGQVFYKAELGSVSRSVCQLQGVWVRPELRGHGLGTYGTAAVVKIALAEVAPTISLYVNDYNVAAQAAYRRVGFRQVGQFMSVLF